MGACASGRRDSRRAALGALIACVLLTGATARAACPPQGLAPPGWRPHLRAAISYAQHRRGDVAFAVRYGHRLAAYRPDHREWSASVLKAMLLVAYLDRPGVVTRALSSSERALLEPMIRRSDNAAADTIDSIVGAEGLRRLAHRVGMTNFVPAQPVWGESEITPRDQTRFLLHIDSFVVPRHRAFAMRLLATVVPSQRWGVGRVAPRGWALFFKGGWGSGTGLIDNQVALLTQGCERLSVAVLTMRDGSHAYGKQTLRGLFARLLTGLPGPPRTRRPQAAPARHPARHKF